MGRPRKYASDAERQAAYRARWARLSVDIQPDLVQTIQEIADIHDVSISEVTSQLIRFALLNFAWKSGVAFPNRLMGKASGSVRRRNPDGSYIED